MHLLIDGYKGDAQKLADEGVVREFLSAIPGMIGMTPIPEPHIVRYEGVNAHDGGLTGFRVIAESHVSIHTYPETGSLWVDVFSCNRFDAGVVVEAVEEVFGLGQTKVLSVARGLQEPYADSPRWQERFRPPVEEPGGR